MTKSTGCNCKKSLCLKKYCECFFTGMFCFGDCKCVNCENYAGSVMLVTKRDKMRKEQEAADLAAKVGAAAAQAVTGNNVNAEEVKRQAMKEKRAHMRTQQELQLRKQEEEQRFQIERQQQVQDQYRQAQQQHQYGEGGYEVGGRYSDSIEPNFSYQMGQMAMSSGSKGGVTDDHQVGYGGGGGGAGGAKGKSPRYKDFQPMDFDMSGLLTDQDWNLAAEAAADILNTDLPASTKSQTGKSPSHKKNRFISPRTSDWNDMQKAKGGKGAKFSFT